MKNDLSKLVAKKRPILHQQPAQINSGLAGQGAMSLTRTRPLKPESEKVSQRVQVMLTKTEYNKLIEAAGAVPMSKYLRMLICKNS